MPIASKYLSALTLQLPFALFLVTFSMSPPQKEQMCTHILVAHFPLGFIPPSI